jgi:iron uptake system component EfeO
MISRSLSGNRRLVLAAGCLLTASVVAGVSLSLAARRTSAGPPTISISATHCGQGWTHPHAGTQTVWLENRSDAGAEAEVIDPRTGAIYGEIDNLGPGTTRPLRVTLGDGTFAVRCLVEDMDAVVGPWVTITGSHTRGGPAVLPVTVDDLLTPLRENREYVQSGLDQLAGQTDVLLATVRAGDLDRARAGWLAAHLTYERLGVAHGAFGDFGARIDGRPDGLSEGVRDPGFTGFYRLEYGLWHGQPSDQLRHVAERLDQEVHTLDHAWAGMELDPGDLGLRAHEIMEDALQDELSDDADEGSGTDLAAALASLQGTREVLATLRPLLLTRYAELSELDTWLDRVEGLLQAERRSDGAWTPVASLTDRQREQLDGAIGRLLELLAPVAIICDPRRTA